MSKQKYTITYIRQKKVDFFNTLNIWLERLFETNVNSKYKILSQTEFRYSVDGYIPKYNITIDFEKDFDEEFKRLREYEIRNKLNCKMLELSIYDNNYDNILNVLAEITNPSPEPPLPIVDDISNMIVFECEDQDAYKVKSFLTHTNDLLFAAKDIGVLLKYSNTGQAISYNCERRVTIKEYIQENLGPITKQITRQPSNTMLIEEKDVLFLFSKRSKKVDLNAKKLIQKIEEYIHLKNN